MAFGWSVTVCRRSRGGRRRSGWALREIAGVAVNHRHIRWLAVHRVFADAVFAGREPQLYAPGRCSRGSARPPFRKLLQRQASILAGKECGPLSRLMLPVEPDCGQFLCGERKAAITVAQDIVHPRRLFAIIANSRIDRLDAGSDCLAADAADIGRVVRLLPGGPGRHGGEPCCGVHPIRNLHFGSSVGG